MLTTWVKTLYRWNFGSIGSVNNMISNYVIVRIKSYIDVGHDKYIILCNFSNLWFLIVSFVLASSGHYKDFFLLVSFFIFFVIL